MEALSKEEVVDTNGAGDSFVGGFLYELYKGNNLEQCVATGSKLAREVVKRSGCTFPEHFMIWYIYSTCKYWLQNL